MAEDEETPWLIGDMQMSTCLAVRGVHRERRHTDDGDRADCAMPNPATARLRFAVDGGPAFAMTGSDPW